MLIFNLISQVLKAKKRVKFSPSQIKYFQLQEFRKLAKFANENSSFYNKIIKEKNINLQTCVPEDFPILTKTDVVENFDEIVTNPEITKARIIDFLSKSTDPGELFLGKYYVVHTSGSSGQVGYNIYNQTEFATGIAHSNRLNGTVLLKKMSFLGTTKGHFAGATMVASTKKLFPIYSGTQMLDINTPFTEIVESLNTFKPNILTGYSFVLKKLAEAKNNGNLNINPETVVSGGEPLFSEDKDYIQNAFGVEVVNNYASTEFLIMGCGKDSLEGMYLMEDTLYIEMKQDCTLITNLFGKTLPLIRYKSTDVLEKIEDSSNFYPFTKIQNLVGRNELNPVFVNDQNEEDFISSYLMVEIFLKGLNSFQIILESNRSFTVKLQYERGLSDVEKLTCRGEISGKLQLLLDQKKMTRVTFKVEEVDKLWSDSKTGKFKLIVKNY